MTLAGGTSHGPLAAVILMASTRLLVAHNSPEAIMNGIMAGYDHNARPSYPRLTNSSSCSIDGNPDPVSFDLGIESMYSVDEKKLSYVLDGYFRASWRDPRLAFPDSVCLEELVLESPSIGSRRIWTPGFYIQNALATQMGGDEGEAVFIQRDGTVFWSRRMRVELQCPEFNFGQFPYDSQMCKIIVGVYRYRATQLRLSWTDASASDGAIDQIRPLRSGCWTASLQDAHEEEKTYLSGTYRYARACLRFERSPGKYDQKILMAVLLVGASYTGFFIDPSAAPARVILGFLSFLIVQNNLDSVLQDMPPVRSVRDGGEHVWLVDFLYGTTVFPFFTLLEYGLVHHGMQVAGRDALSSNSASVRATKAHRLHRGVWVRCAQLDIAMRWLFPLLYGIFFIAMYAALSAYPHNDTCIYS